MEEPKKGLVPKAIEELAHYERSPFLMGFLRAIQAAAIGGPVGAVAALAKGISPVTGAAIGAVTGGAAGAFAGAASRKLRNLDTEAALRYHAERIKEREPTFFMPPRQQMARYFTGRR